ncbi:hypothetical protein BDV25DRAFT_146571 [Aspergillus avenaceus]|uniref:Uncharacterized protein n=1 Tax=Aspergillus avenaceus TaxID=36643 RepID=A0A5N6U905_ASPAV|nr:hypothetical protein BDV25DRAFT_146571 [Aspergillus avenaceus]
MFECLPMFTPLSNGLPKLMLAKPVKRVLPLVGIVLLLVLSGFQVYHRHVVYPFSTPASVPSLNHDPFSRLKSSDGQQYGDLHQQNNDASSHDEDMSATHVQLFSPSTPDGRLFHIDFAGRLAINPSIIPHPERPHTWIITAQLHKSSDQKSSVWFAELVCDATFDQTGRTLACSESPLILPIAATIGGSDCVGDLAYFSLNIGPHDARVFYGPKAPYTLYGSNSEFTCFGQWILDFRRLVDWPAHMDLLSDYGFRRATELQRPSPYGAIEKNWFLFWDTWGQPYVHYDVAPTRVFARLERDGSVGSDLSPLTADADMQCLQRYLPPIQQPNMESIHQATNSLAITLCHRADPQCQVNEENTYILTIFHHKSFYSFHSVYEPYAMLFRQTPPFAIHGLSTKPLWISGRGAFGKGKKPDTLTPDQLRTWNQTEMLYITAISWKTQGLKYQGYLDDLLFIAFGREDSDTGGIDVVAGDLLKEMGFCGGMG